MIEITEIEKRKGEDKKHTTNCYDCEIMLSVEDAKKNPGDEGDKRIFCVEHYKKRFGKKKKLIKRY